MRNVTYTYATLTNRFSDKDTKILVEAFIDDEEEKKVNNKDMNEEHVVVVSSIFQFCSHV